MEVDGEKVKMEVNKESVESCDLQILNAEPRKKGRPKGSKTLRFQNVSSYFSDESTKSGDDVKLYGSPQVASTAIIFPKLSPSWVQSTSFIWFKDFIELLTSELCKFKPFEEVEHLRFVISGGSSGLLSFIFIVISCPSRSFAVIVLNVSPVGCDDFTSTSVAPNIDSLGQQQTPLFYILKPDIRIQPSKETSSSIVAGNTLSSSSQLYPHQSAHLSFGSKILLNF
jgi:hypothetical protein